MFMSCNLVRSARVVIRKPLLVKLSLKRSFKTDQSLLQRRGFVQRLAITISKLEHGSNLTGRFAVGIGQCLASGIVVLTAGGFAHYVFGVGQLNPLDFNVLPEYVQTRIVTTYLYFGGAVMLSLCSSVFCMRLLQQNSGLLRLVVNNSMAFILGAFASQFIIGTTLAQVEFTEQFGLKQFLYVVQSVIIGATLAPIVLLGGCSVSRAAFVSTGICGSLAIIGSNTTAHTFRGWEQPLSIGRNVVLVAFIGYMLGGRMTPYSNILYRTFMHGGVALFSLMFMYNSNKIVHHAKFYPGYHDPINGSTMIFMDAINIFGRLFFLIPGPRFIDREGSVSKWNTR